MTIIQGIASGILRVLWFLVKLVGGFVRLGLLLIFFVIMCVSVTVLLLATAGRFSGER